MANDRLAGQQAVGSLSVPLPVAEEPVPIFSFANGELGFLQNRAIRLIERLTGQPRIKKLYLDYVDDQRPPARFWQDALDRLHIRLDVTSEVGAEIPETGPLLVIANHPFGVVDGVTLCALIAKKRQDYKMITHRVLRQAPAVMDKILPIDFDEDEKALANNLATRKQALAWLETGGVLVIFPSGAISRSPSFFGPAQDPEWKKFVAKLAKKSGVSVLPVHFTGKNSVLFQMAIRASLTLGYALMFREICQQMYRRLPVTMRSLIRPEEIAAIDSRSDLVSFLRARTYGLAEDNQPAKEER